MTPEEIADLAHLRRAHAVSDDPNDRYVLFELQPTELRCNGYGDVTLPPRRRWRAEP